MEKLLPSRRIKRRNNEAATGQEPGFADADLPRDTAGNIDWDIVPVAQLVRLGAFTTQRIIDANGKTTVVVVTAAPLPG